VCIGLGAYAYYGQAKKPVAADTHQKVFSVEADKINEVTIDASSGKRTTLKKVDGDWRETVPADAPADAAEASGIVTGLASLDIDRVIDEKPADLKPYGLDKPTMQIGFSTESGQKKQLVIGSKNATGVDMYAKLPDGPRVFLVPSYLEQTFDKTPFDLRDKALLTFDRDKLDELTIATPKQTLAFTKQGAGSWTMDKPLHAAADDLTLENLVGRLQATQMKSIVADDATDLKKYGLDKPQAQVTLAAGSAQTTLQIGAKAPDGNLYARDAAQPRIVTVEASLLDDLDKAPNDFRQRDLFNFRSYNANDISITRNGKTVAYQLEPGSGKDAKNTWQEVSPKKAPVTDSNMEDLLTQLSGLRAASFVPTTAHTGLDKPVVTISVKYQANKNHETVTFGQEGTDVYAARADQPGAAKLDASAFTSAMKALDALQK
ncbi:MAG TPA: DUF4340 domain-containing protein, partial [Vicinamibacterales bacterium]|jgi:hypothetical protein